MSCVYPNCVETRLYTRQNQLRAIGQEQRCENCPKNADETNALLTAIKQGRIHGRISCVRLGSSSDAKTARKNKCVTDQLTDQPTNRPTDQPADGWTKREVESRARD